MEKIYNIIKKEEGRHDKKNIFSSYFLNGNILNNIINVSIGPDFGPTKIWGYQIMVHPTVGRKILYKIKRMSYPRGEDLFPWCYFAGLVPVCAFAFGADIGIFLLIAWYPGVSASFALVSF